MSKRKCHVCISVLIPFLMISLFAVVLIMPPASAQENAIFSVSPGSFTASKVPPLGTPYTIPQNLVVWNRDNTERVALVTSEIPPASEVTPGYVPIPNENWVRPLPSTVLIKENSYAIIQLSFDIPNWDNLVGQKWEVWIPVERQPLPGEVGVLRPTVRVKIETTAELPAPERTVSLALLLVVGIVIAVAIICLGVWLYSRKTGVRKTRKMRSLRSQG
jgi:hypothetical protein